LLKTDTKTKPTRITTTTITTSDFLGQKNKLGLSLGKKLGEKLSEKAKN